MKTTILILLFASLQLSAQDWQVYTSENSLLPDAAVTEIIVDYDNNTWVAAGGGLVKMKNKIW